MNLDLYGHFVAVLQHLQDAMHQQELDNINLRRRNDELQEQLWRLNQEQKEANAPS